MQRMRLPLVRSSDQLMLRMRSAGAAGRNQRLSGCLARVPCGTRHRCQSAGGLGGGSRASCPLLIQVGHSKTVFPERRAPKVSGKVIDEGTDLHRHQPVAVTGRADRACGGSHTSNTLRNAPARSGSDTAQLGSIAMPLPSSAAAR